MKMDAVEFMREKNRMCRSIRYCKSCGIWERKPIGEDCASYTEQHIECVVKVVEKWSRENPEKTRKGELLKMFPRSSIGEDGILPCPLIYDSEISCEGMSDCDLCKRGFWLTEVV